LWVWKNQAMTLKRAALILIPVGLVLLAIGIAGYVAMTDFAALFWVGAAALIAGIVLAVTSAWRRQAR
jgi:uncharacterized membrane protein HdeD (DUF308 family)